MSKRLGKGLAWAATQARGAIHDNDVERLKQLLTEYPALLAWQDNDWDSNRWNGTARSWAFHAANDEKMAQWLDDAERQRENTARAPGPPA